MLQRHPLSLAIVLSSLALVACNSNDDDNANLPSKAVTTTTITVTPSLGKILNAKVSLRNAKTNAEIVTAKALDANGVASFVVPTASLAEPILASVIPNDTGDVQYFDEATNSLQTIAITAANRTQPLLRAAAKVTANTNIGVTALTEAAVQTAAAKAGGLAVNIDSVNQLIKTQLKLTHSILQAPLVIGSTAQYNQLASTAISESQRVYAAYLANLAKQAALLNPSSTQPAFDIVQTLAADFKDDSQLNASFDASKIAIAYSSAFATAWLEAFSKVLAALKNLPATNPDITSFFATAGQNTAIAQPIRVVDGVAEYACADENKLRSSAGSQGMNIDFMNQSGAGLKIFWLNYNGGRVSYNANLANTQTHAQGTYVTHPWVVTDSSGVCKGIYRPITRTNKMITIKADEVVIGGSNPVVGNADTCATFGVNPSTLAAIEDFVGNYEVTASGVAKSNFQVMANGDISLKGQTAQFKEVCKNPTQNNGQGYRLITTKATILLFRETNNALLAEGKDFANTSAGVFEGYKKVTTDPLKPIRTMNGVEEYSCDSWTKIGNGTADGTPIISFANQLGTNTSLSLFGLSSINRTTTLFTGIQNAATRQQPALKNQFVRVDSGGGECKGVFKAITNTDKTLTFKTTGVEVTDTAVVNNCTSQGADNKLGFANAPNDFCGFTRGSSSLVADNSEEVYSFVSTAGETANIVVKQNVLASVTVSKNAKYSFACGLANTTPCQNTVFNNQTTFKEFGFTNTVLSAIGDITRTLTLKNGSLIHQLPVVTPPTTASCAGNTNPFGCLSITGTNAPAAMVEHVGSPFLFNGGPQVQMNGSSSGAVTWFGSGPKANETNAGVVMGFQRVVGSTQNASYTFQQYDANLGLISNLSFKCKDANNDCAGLSINLTDKTVTFNNVVMIQNLPAGTNAELTFNGVLKY